MHMLIDFGTKQVPEHTQQALENYFIHGYQPGGFLTACLSGDLYRAVSTADTINRQALWHIVRWIMNHAPEGSWGSDEAMRGWTADRHGCRTLYRDQQAKARTWLTLVK